jgi:hypothetical protein
LTFGTDLPNEEQMYKIDSLITTPLIAVYNSLMSIVFLNLFIALLSSSLSNVYDKGEAYLTFKRAKEILKIERSLDDKFSIKYFFLRVIRFAACMDKHTEITLDRKTIIHMKTQRIAIFQMIKLVKLKNKWWKWLI